MIKIAFDPSMNGSYTILVSDSAVRSPLFYEI